uniref:F-box domain-containing protein n=1 Tax=Glycine max TaxID=3847 RepID=K7N4Z4_SOYBN
MKFEDLAEGCMAKILSYTTRADVCRLSLVSKAFHSAAEANTVWDCFLPSDLSSIISPSSSVPPFRSIKDLYLYLSDRPTIIDQGIKSFQLEKRTGNKCYMLSARDLSIIWGDTTHYWEWTTLPESSRFEEVARLRAVCWFDITGRMNTRVLSPNTNYAAFLVFKMIDAGGFHYDPAVLSVGILGGNSSTKNVCLDPNLVDNRLDDRFHGLQRPTVRSDGWLEIEMGEFFNPGLEEDELQIKVSETTSNWWKRGFILEGIEVRPKHV